MTYEETITKTQQELKEHASEWQDRYMKYLTNALENKESILKRREKFHTWGNLKVYYTLGKASRNSNCFDLRYQGQSVGEIRVYKNDEVKLFINEDQYGHNCDEKYFIGYPKDICVPNKKGYLWKSSIEARKFKLYFKTDPGKQGHPEARFESLLLEEFSKPNKSLPYIKPVTIGTRKDLYFQMTTPLSASGESKRFAEKKGGGIDILARKQKGATNTLTIFELKDKNEINEGPEKVICQAIAYATFIVELCNTEARDKFWEFCGFNGKKHGNETINVSILMPDPGGESYPDFTFKELSVPGSKMRLKLHCTYFDENAKITRSSLNE